MSDPGITYRTRDEVNDVRKNRDPIEIVRKLLLDNKWAKEDELKDIEKKVRAKIDEDVEKIKNDPEPTAEDLYTHVGVTHHPIRGVEYKLSQW
jgi:pyruvate dehydrogenase E1 component alpha subunit